MVERSGDGTTSPPLPSPPLPLRFRRLSPLPAFSFTAVAAAAAAAAATFFPAAVTDRRCGTVKSGSGAGLCSMSCFCLA